MSHVHDLDEKYVQRIRKMPMLSLDEEYQLAKKWRDSGDKKSVEKLIESHLRLVAKIAQGYRGYGLPLSDLVSEGHVGMMQAMKHYDPDKGFRFSTYALWWIKASIQEYVLRAWSLVKVGTTAGQKKLFFNLNKEKKRLDVDNINELPDDIVKAIATKLKVREDEVVQMNQRLQGPDYSLNAPLKAGVDSESEWIEWLSDDHDNPEVAALHQNEMKKRREFLDLAMICLNSKEKEIIIERRLTEPPKTLEEVSKVLNLSRERVRQIEIIAFDKLQKSMKRSSHVL